MTRNAIRPGARDEAHNWCSNYEDVVEFGAYLAREFVGTSELQEYYAKPWHWTAERACLLAYRAAGRPDPDLDELSALAHSPNDHVTLSEMRAATPAPPEPGDILCGGCKRWTRDCSCE